MWWICHDVCMRVCMWVGVSVWVCTPDWSDLKLSTVVVLDTMSQSTYFGFRRARVRVRELALICIYRECIFSSWYWSSIGEVMPGSDRGLGFFCWWVVLLLLLLLWVMFIVSEVQYGRTASIDEIVEACRRNKVILKGIIASPLHSEEGILQTLNMKIRYLSTISLVPVVEIWQITTSEKTLSCSAQH